MCACSAAQSCPALCDPVDCSQPGSPPLSMGFSGQEYWSGSHSLPQGTFLTQGLNLCLLHCRWILYHMSHQESHVRSMNQDKLDVVRQEMARVNTDILEISELKWMGIGKFNSDDHYINTYSCEQESLRRNGVAFIVNKSLKCSTWVQPQK